MRKKPEEFKKLTNEKREKSRQYILATMAWIMAWIIAVWQVLLSKLNADTNILILTLVLNTIIFFSLIFFYWKA
ncbi:MAG: hypothetical protein QXU74_00175 [Candidatus Aenigmatarchaeota archaeon]